MLGPKSYRCSHRYLGTHVHATHAWWPPDDLSGHVLRIATQTPKHVFEWGCLDSKKNSKAVKHRASESRYRRDARHSTGYRERGGPQTWFDRGGRCAAGVRGRDRSEFGAVSSTPSVTSSSSPTLPLPNCEQRWISTRVAPRCRGLIELPADALSEIAGHQVLKAVRRTTFPPQESISRTHTTQRCDSMRNTITSSRGE